MNGLCVHKSLLSHVSMRLSFLAAAQVLGGGVKTVLAQTEVNLTSTTFAGTGSDEGLGMCVTSGDFDGGEQTRANFGACVESVGDINGDGQTDIVISSFLHSTVSNAQVGRVYVFLLPDYATDGWPLPADKHWSASSANVIIDGPDDGHSYAHFGASLACNGNTNRGTDSKSDILVGAPGAYGCAGQFENDLYRDYHGYAFLFRLTPSLSGGPDPTPLFWEALSDCVEYYKIKCDAERQMKYPFLGQSLAFIGDADGDVDSNDDYLFGAPGGDSANYNYGNDDIGCVYAQYR